MWAWIDEGSLFRRKPLLEVLSISGHLGHAASYRMFETPTPNRTSSPVTNHRFAMSSWTNTCSPQLKRSFNHEHNRKCFLLLFLWGFRSFNHASDFGAQKIMLCDYCGWCLHFRFYFQALTTRRAVGWFLAFMISPDTPTSAVWMFNHCAMVHSYSGLWKGLMVPLWKFRLSISDMPYLSLSYLSTSILFCDIYMIFMEYLSNKYLYDSIRYRRENCGNLCLKRAQPPPSDSAAGRAARLRWNGALLRRSDGPCWTWRPRMSVEATNGGRAGRA